MARREFRCEYRGFRIHVWDQGNDSWFGLAKGHGGVVMPNLSPDAESAVDDITRRIDIRAERLARKS